MKKLILPVFAFIVACGALWINMHPKSADHNNVTDAEVRFWTQVAKASTPAAYPRTEMVPAKDSTHTWPVEDGQRNVVGYTYPPPNSR